MSSILRVLSFRGEAEESAVLEVGFPEKADSSLTFGMTIYVTFRINSQVTELL